MHIEKVGHTPPETKKPSHRTKTAKRSILKVRGVADPATSRKHSIRMLTAKGAKKQRHATKKRISNMKKEEIDAAIGKKIKLNPTTPEHIKKQLLEHGVSAGFLSLD